MRQLRQLVLGMALGLSAIAVPALDSGDAHADARSDARAHYLAGQKAYSAGDYKAAIREFSSAQSLAPADLNNYNLALCYDKLGDAEPAVQYYKAYLDKVPGTDKRAEIEASIQRLDSAVKSSQAKKAEEARKAEEAQRAIEAKKLEDQRREEDARRVAEAEARRQAEEAKKEPIGPVPVGVGSTGTPSTGQIRPTGDSQIDRVNQINIDEIRDQRVGGSASGIPSNRRPPSGGPTNPRVGSADPNANPYPPANAQDPDPRTAQTQPRGAQPNAEPAAPTDKPKQTPVYKKWWFWAVVGVSAYVLYSIASEDSRSTSSARTLLPQGPTGSTSGGGMTLMRF
jgi:hypothetical protein